MFPSLNTEVRRSREKRWLSQFLPSFTFKCQTRRRNETTSPAIHTHTHAKIKVWGAKVSLHVKWRWCKRRKKDEFGGETTRRRSLHTFLSFTSLSLSFLQFGSFSFRRFLSFHEVARLQRHNEQQSTHFSSFSCQPVYFSGEDRLSCSLLTQRYILMLDSKQEQLLPWISWGGREGYKEHSDWLFVHRWMSLLPLTCETQRGRLNEPETRIRRVPSHLGFDGCEFWSWLWLPGSLQRRTRTSPLSSVQYWTGSR